MQIGALLLPAAAAMIESAARKGVNLNQVAFVTDRRAAASGFRQVARQRPLAFLYAAGSGVSRRQRIQSIPALLRAFQSGDGGDDDSFPPAGRDRDRAVSGANLSARNFALSSARTEPRHQVRP